MYVFPAMIVPALVVLLMIPMFCRAVVAVMCELDEANVPKKLIRVDPLKLRLRVVRVYVAVFSSPSSDVSVAPGAVPVPRAMRLIWSRSKLVVEPSAAVTLAAVMGDIPRFRGKRVVLVLSGGNVDLDRLPFRQS